MADITVADRARIEFIVNRLEKAGAGGGTLDGTSVEVLARIFRDTCGFDEPGRASFLEEISEAPVRTLLKLLLCPSILPIVTGAISGPTTAGLGNTDADTFAVFGGAAVANSGLSAVNGDLGVGQGASLSGFPPGVVNGNTHVNDSTALLAQTAITDVYNNLNARPGGTPIGAEIGGQTFLPGLYKATGSLAISSGNLILNALGNVNASFIFQVGNAFSIGEGRSVILTGGALASNVFWKVISANLGAVSLFKGNIISLNNIVVEAGAAVLGRLLTRLNGSVTLDTNNVTIPV